MEGCRHVGCTRYLRHGEQSDDVCVQHLTHFRERLLKQRPEARDGRVVDEYIYPTCVQRQTNLRKCIQQKVTQLSVTWTGEGVASVDMLQPVTTYVQHRVEV